MLSSGRPLRWQTLLALAGSLQRGAPIKDRLAARTALCALVRTPFAIAPLLEQVFQQRVHSSRGGRKKEHALKLRLLPRRSFRFTLDPLWTIGNFSLVQAHMDCQ